MSVSLHREHIFVFQITTTLGRRSLNGRRRGGFWWWVIINESRRSERCLQFVGCSCAPSSKTSDLCGVGLFGRPVSLHVPRRPLRPGVAYKLGVLVHLLALPLTLSLGMSGNGVFCTTSICAAATLALALGWQRSGTQPPYPPGPRGYPLVGSILKVPRDAPMWKGFVSIAEKFGKCSTFNVQVPLETSMDLTVLPF